MTEYLWVTRPKRKLNSIPEVLATVAEVALNQIWNGQRDAHLALETALEKGNLKRTGERRDQGGGGGRTYASWLFSLGLVFKHEASGQTKLTLAGEAILSGRSPVEVLKQQVLRYQFPSPFSLAEGISQKFRVRPFRFLLNLMLSPEISYLTQSEIANVILLEAVDESEKIIRKVTNQILEFRDHGTPMSDEQANERCGSSYGNLDAIANTMINWLEYTQLIDREPGLIRITEGKISEVAAFLAKNSPLIDKPEYQERFQRKYGVDPYHDKDTRDITRATTVTERMLNEASIRRNYLLIALRRPVLASDNTVVSEISQVSGISETVVKETIQRLFPNGNLPAFMTEYYEMAFKGRDDAINFERATSEILRSVFGFEVEHVGQKGAHPDIAVVSNSGGFSGILDNKAYRSYPLDIDHRNKMVDQYIPSYRTYRGKPLAFFSYIAGGFAPSVHKNLQEIVIRSGVQGSAIAVRDFIKMIELQPEKKFTHGDFRKLFASNRIVSSSDIVNLA